MKHPVILSEEEAWQVMKALRRGETLRAALVEAGFTDLLDYGLESNDFLHAIRTMTEAGAADLTAPTPREAS